MARFPSKPQHGQPVIKELYNSICEVIDYLPSLEVRGDQKSTYVTKSGAGTVIHAAQNNFNTTVSNQYEAGSGIVITSGNVINAHLSAGPNIRIWEQSGYLVISGTPSGSGGGGGGGETYDDGRFITISGDNNSINCTLSALSELYNLPIISDSRPLSSEIESTYVYPNHFMQFKDWIGNKGQNTIITSGSFINTHMGAGSPDDWQYIFQYTGPQVDCLLTGGRFIDVHSHWQDSGGETPEETEPDDHTVNSLLSGDGSHIFIKELTGVNEINANGSWGGIISTNIHGDETTIHMAADGTLSCIGGSPSPGPGGGGCPWPEYANLGEQSDSLVYPLMRYTTSTGGWIRISCRGGTSRCVGIWVGDNYVGLGMGINTWTLAIPPASSFYVDVDWNPNTFVWFDSTVTPAKMTREEFNYWLQPPTWEPNRDTILSAKQKLEQARGAEQDCYNSMIGAQSYLKSMIDDWTEYIEGVHQQPQSSGWYEDCLNQISGKYDSCSASYDTANDYCLEGTLLNTSLPSANPMYTYQFRDISQKCQQYTETIQQYITSGQYYLGLAVDYWNSQE